MDKLKFDDIVLRISTGLNPRKNFVLNSGGLYNYVTIKNIKNGDLINLESCDKIDEKAFVMINKRSDLKKDDILFASIGTNGESYIIKSDPSDWNINESVFTIRLKKDFLPKFIYFYLKSPYCIDYYKKYQTGSTFKSLKISQLKEMKIKNYDLNEQKSICTVLDNIEKMISINFENIIDLKKLIYSRYFDLFGNVLSNDSEYQLKEWHEVLQIKNGKNQKKVENSTGKYPIYGSGGIMSYADDFICNEDTVIVGRKGNINNPIFVKSKFWNVDTAFGLEADRKYILPEYLFYFCKLFNFELLNKTTTIPSLTKVDLLKIKMPIPPIDLQ